MNKFFELENADERPSRRSLAAAVIEEGASCPSSRFLTCVWRRARRFVTSAYAGREEWAAAVGLLLGNLLCESVTRNRHRGFVPRGLGEARPWMAGAAVEPLSRLPEDRGATQKAPRTVPPTY